MLASCPLIRKVWLRFPWELQGGWEVQGFGLTRRFPSWWSHQRGLLHHMQDASTAHP